jgi:hypothetical protein
MAIDDFSIYGISASLIISVVSLGIAIYAVYLTYTQSKLSHDQFQLELRKLEKPRILEKIQNALNSIQNEMEIELGTIRKMEMVWFIGNEQNNLCLTPLVFPICKMKKFYTGFQKLFPGPENIPTEQFSETIRSVDNNLKDRHEKYKQIDLDLQRLGNLIRQAEIDQRITAIVSKQNTFFLVPSSESPESWDIYKYDEIVPFRENAITKNELEVIVTSMIISTIFKPLKKDELRLGCLSYGFLIDVFFPHIEQSIHEKPIPESEEIKKRVLKNLSSLKAIDESILKDIISMKDVYRDRYILTDAELDPYQGMV